MAGAADSSGSCAGHVRVPVISESMSESPVVSFSGGGVTNLTAVLTGTAITGFTITNGRYVNYFSFPPPIIIKGGGGYALTSCTITNGVIVGITIPAAGNYFSSVPTVSVYGSNNNFKSI
jgi:hypothetical protein